MAAWRSEEQSRHGGGEHGLPAPAIPAQPGRIINDDFVREQRPRAMPPKHAQSAARTAKPTAASAVAAGSIALTVPNRERKVHLSAEWATRLNLLIDLALIGGVVLANGINVEIASPSHVVGALVTLIAVWLITASVLGYYDNYAYKRESLDDMVLASTMLLALVFAAALLDGAPRWTDLRRVLPVWWPTLIFVRLLLSNSVSAWGTPVEQAVIVGTGPLGRITGEDLARRGRQRVLGYLVLANELKTFVLRPPLLGTWMDLENVLRTNPVSEVYIAADAMTDPCAGQHAISVCETLGIPFAVPAFSQRIQRAKPLLGKALSDGYLHFASSDARRWQCALKRIGDLVAASVALWLLAPLFVVVAVLIKTTSRGPVFFKQRRCGLHGKPFKLIKFRSMVVDAEQHRRTLESLNDRNGPVFKLRKDPRVTPIGSILRKYSIDELPQLINILRGEMSIVGPRPPLQEEVAKYEAWQLRRLSMRPGLTCLWQISADRHRISFDEWMYLDLQYVDHWNLWKDANIILRTVPVVVTGSGEPTNTNARYNLKASVR
jgi:exopolysaccharide biosynthesis polyprenyl glycosylphosphotransferase